MLRAVLENIVASLWAQAGIPKLTQFLKQNERGSVAVTFMELWYEAGSRASS